MVIIGSIGITLITLFALEKRGKITINTYVLSFILLLFSAIGVWWIMGEVIDTFLL